ncbi:MAG: hypothetical protein AB1560_02085 [Pseudomonadota bacterium]
MPDPQEHALERATAAPVIIVGGGEQDINGVTIYPNRWGYDVVSEDGNGNPTQIRTPKASVPIPGVTGYWLQAIDWTTFGNPQPGPWMPE